MGSAVIKEFLKIKDIHTDLVNLSKPEVSKTLSKFYTNIGQLYIDVGDSEVKNNLLNFFEYLK